MYNVYTQMPDVTWSTVPGPRSIGYKRKELEAAEKTYDAVVRQLAIIGIPGIYAVLVDGQEVILKRKIE